MDGVGESLLDFGEAWRTVVGYEGIYEVSDLGRVRSVATGKIRVAPIIRTGSGYRKLGLSRDKVVRFYWVHRLVCTAFHGAPTEIAPMVRHLNGDSLDNRAENLKWGTQSENEQDKVRHGMHHNKRKTHCKWGHEFTAENTLQNNYPGSRRCKACRDRDNARRCGRRRATNAVRRARRDAA